MARMKILSKHLHNILVEDSGFNSEGLSSVDLDKLIKDLIAEYTAKLRLSIDTSTQKILADQRENSSSFTSRNENRWKEAFDLLEMHIYICTEAGERVNFELRPDAVQNNDILFDILVRHHARACHMANEILCMLKNGFADAAHARWRALHEVNVTAMFINKHGQECAKRFYFHDIVDSYDSMQEHKRYEERLQSKAVSKEVIEVCKVDYDNVIKKFGKGYGSHYGWASYIFPKLKPYQVGFRSLEKEVGLDHMRPYYKWASQNVHAGSKGLRNRLSLDECQDDVLIVGQSNSGMTDPAHATAISLMQITFEILKMSSDLDNVVLMNLIREYSDDIGAKFLKISKESFSNQNI